MGENEGSLPNGLLPEAGPVMQPINAELWIKAEERTSELIACIQPNQLSEERRNAVADYVQKLITKCFPCQVCTFGSVPLKTYLPDGDIDLTVFSHDQNLKETWASQVRDMLENEEKNENAEFHVKEVQYIHAEVKIIKCLVENIVVDISFNQVGGLCTLCFLDEVDNLINQNHLFKRSIILIKAWCYYESRILGAHHGLISTYALEILVLYIFHVFNNSFHGPLEVLYRFLEFFSNFDWDNFCVSLWGPVPIKSLPGATAEPPRKDSGDLLLNKLFLDACSSVYAVFPAGQESNGQPFVSKHFNVIDPLRVSNNLGRSVSKGNFFRIRSAFAFGAKKLARLLICPKENLVFEVNQFFMNTWERHGSGCRPDAPGLDSWRLRLSTPSSPHELDPSENDNTSRKNVTENSIVFSSEHARTPPVTNAFSPTLSLKNQLNMVELNDEVPRDAKAEVLMNDTQGRYLFARTRSSPELTETFTDVSSQALRLKAEPAESQTINTRLDSFSRSSVGDSSSSRHVSSNQNIDADAMSEELLTSSGPHLMSQEEQDMVNMMASASLQGQYHIPFNLNHGHLPFPFPFPPSLLASMTYPQRNFRSANIPLMNPSFSNIQFPHSLVSPNFTQYFPNIGLNAPPPEDSVKQNNEIIDVYENDGYDTEIGNIDVQQIEDKPTILKYIPPFRARGKQEPVRENIDRVSVQDTRSGEVYSEERSTSSRLSSGTHNNNSLRSRTSSESSWDGSVKTSKSMKEKRGKKVAPPDLVTGQGKGKIISDHVSYQAEEDDQECEASTEIVESGPRHHVTGFEVTQTSGSESTVPFPPTLIGPGSRQRAGDISGMVAFYPTGPPIPFLTMLPFYNTSGASSAHFGNNETLNNSEPEQNFPPERFDQVEDLSSVSSSRGTSNVETFEERKPDILNSDFESHWQNLQVGRLCQNSRFLGPLIYPSSSPVMVPPVYLQGGTPFGRPLASNPNIFSQFMANYGNQMVPVAPVQSVASRPPNGFQRFVDEMPRHRSGTGTYLPNPVSIRERHTSSRRGNYNHDRNDNYGDRDGNHWNGNSKARGAPRSNSRVQTEKLNSRTDRLGSNESRSDRPWNSFRQDPYPSYQFQNGPSHATSCQNGPHNVACGTYQGGASNGPVPPVTMCYPYEHDTPSYSPYDEQFGYGSVGPGGIPGMNEQSQVSEGTRPIAYEDLRLHGNSVPTTPDSPSSPLHQRDYFQRNRR